MKQQLVIAVKALILLSLSVTSTQGVQNCYVCSTDTSQTSSSSSCADPFDKDKMSSFTTSCDLTYPGVTFQCYKYTYNGNTYRGCAISTHCLNIYSAHNQGAIANATCCTGNLCNTAASPLLTMTPSRHVPQLVLFAMASLLGVTLLS